MRNFVSILLLVLLFFLTPVVILVNTIQHDLVTPVFVNKELARLDVYGVALSRLDEQVENIKIDPQYPITNVEIATLAHQVLTRRWLEQNVSSVLDHVDAWLKAPPGTTLVVPIDLRQPKQELTAGVDALLSEKLPQIKPCPNKRLPKEEQGFCQYAGLTVAEVKTQLKHQGLDPELINSLLPDTLDLVNPDLSKIVGTENPNDPNSAAAKSTQIRHNLETFKARYQQVVFLLRLTLVIDALLLLLYFAVNGFWTWHRLARWGGVGLLVAGFLPLGLGIISSVIVNAFVVPNLHIDVSTPADVARLAPLALRDVSHVVSTPLIIVGSVCLILGLAGILGASWVKPPVKGGK